MKLENLVHKTHGFSAVDDNGVKGVLWSGPPEAPENSLLIPLNDLGYNSTIGIFRVSIYPNLENELKL